MRQPIAIAASNGREAVALAAAPAVELVLWADEPSTSDSRLVVLVSKDGAAFWLWIREASINLSVRCDQSHSTRIERRPTFW